MDESKEYIQNKIEKNKDISFLSSMKPLYLTNEELCCGVIQYPTTIYYLDLKDKDKIINLNKSFVFINETDIYPSYSCNYKRITYLDVIFSYSQENVHYHFKNGNSCDIRRCNVDIYHSYHKHILQDYPVVDYIVGHYSTSGKDSNIMKNPLWKITDEYLVMYCEKNTICKLCPISYQKILDFEKTCNNNKKLTWFKGGNGYILCSLNIYIHQIIMNCYGNGKGTKHVSVDHIDQDPLNNAFSNLRIATRKEQEQNTNGIKEGTKRERKHSAKELPEGIQQSMMKKYVVYYQEWLDKEYTKERHFFKVEKHPKLDKSWMTTKSSKVTIEDKLAQANKVVDDLEHDIYPLQEDKLPKYVSLVIIRDKPHLVFEKRMDEKRMNIKMVLPDEYDLQDQLIILNNKITLKYEGTTIL